jgi:Domain of unknown function (DUF397)
VDDTLGYCIESLRVLSLVTPRLRSREELAMAIEPGVVEPTDLTWRKSSACDPSECVEVAGHGDRVLIRDSTATAGPVLEVSRHTWQAFIQDVRHDVEHGVAK